MKFTVTTKNILFFSGLILALALSSSAFYISRINFHKPLTVSVEGFNGEQFSEVQIVRVSPLGRKDILKNEAYIGAGRKADNYLLSDVFILFNDAPIDSVRKIRIQYGGGEYIMEDQVVAQWKKGDNQKTYSLSPYIPADKTISDKVKALASINWGSGVLVMISHGLFNINFAAHRATLAFFRPGIFLLLTLGLPLFLIIFALRRTPVSTLRLSPATAPLYKQIFFACLAGFLVLHAYGIYYYKLRMQLDASWDLMSFSAPDHYQTGVPQNYRFAYLLNMFLMLPSFHLHLPLSMVGRIYSFNDALVCLAVALCILFFTARYDYAAATLAAPVLVLGINYYYIGNALFASGYLMILYAAVYRYMKEGKVRNLVLYPCLFFIIWSHPVAIMLLVAFLPGLYKSLSQICRDKWLLLFIVANLAIRLSLLNQYDNSKIQDLNGGFEWGYLWDFILIYCTSLWYMLLIGVMGVYISVKHKNLSDYIGLVLLPVVVYCCGTGKADMGDCNFTKFLYPVNLLVLTLGIGAIIKGYGHFKKAILILSFFVLVSGMATVLAHYSFFMKRVQLFDNLNAMCYKEDPGQSKWFVQADSIHDICSWNITTEGIPFSAFQHLPVALQVVTGDSSIKKYIDQVPADRFYFFDTSSISTRMLDPYYFHFYRNGKYKELVLDPARLRALRKACE